jgi:DNA-directed RNA polymerase specialized sigma24 family protein
MDIVDYIRDKYKLRRKIVPDFVVLNDNDAIDHDDTSGIEARDIVELLKKELSPENLEFLSLYYMEENLLREIAADHGTTESGESWRGIRMLDKCREILGLEKKYSEHLRRDVVVNIE